MKYLPQLLLVISCLTLCSCNKHRILLEESAKADEERTALLVEIREVDAQLQRLEPGSSSSRSSDDTETRLKKAVALQAEADEARHKWASIEQSLQSLRARTEAYKKAATN